MGRKVGGAVALSVGEMLEVEPTAQCVAIRSGQKPKRR